MTTRHSESLVRFRAPLHPESDSPHPSSVCLEKLTLQSRSAKMALRAITFRIALGHEPSENDFLELSLSRSF